MMLPDLPTVAVAPEDNNSLNPEKQVEAEVAPQIWFSMY
jgi:hypothetical protein